MKYPEFYKKNWPILIIIVAMMICYINSLRNPFVWDQEVTIVGNPLIRSWHYLLDIFKTNPEGRRLTSIGFYRPLEVISFLVDYTFWKLNPFGYHCSSIFLHLCNSLLLFWFLKKIKIKTQISFFASLIFAIHPVNTETVTYSLRGDLLATLFSLICFLCFLHFQQGSKFISAFFCVSAYLLALMSKESAVVVPFIILIYSVLFHRSSKTNPMYLVIVLLSISFIYICIRLSFILHYSDRPLSLISEATLYQRLLTLPRILLTYIGLLIFPHNLHMEYLFVEKNPVSPYIWLGAPLLITMGYWFFKYIKLTSETEFELKRHLIFFLLFFLVGLAPFYNIIVTLHATLLEHWVYFPGIGFIVLMVTLGFLFFKKINNQLFKNIAILIIVSLLSYYGFYTIKRNDDWSDAMRLYQHDLKYEPNSFILHNNVGVIYFRRGELKKAKEEFLRAIQVSPGGRYDTAYNNIGVIYQNEGDLITAEKAFQTSIQLNNYELAYENLGRLYLKLGKIEDAIKISLRGRELYPLNPEINYHLGIGYYYHKQFRLARETFKSLNKIAPRYKDTLYFLNNIREFLKETSND